ncbi:MAG: MoxR family ATPase [Fimbriimonadales bacterium]|nr:MoxR family ATPase [Fimbriimonadales bacterium]
MTAETAPWLSDTEARAVAEQARSIICAVEQVILGKSDTVRLMVIGLLSGGHLLIEDIPGVGKTTLARAIAKAIGGQFRRIQFTPDLLPADVTGSVIYNQARGAFEFHPGPIFANIVLADEINRATPKTQSALLEAMEERRVTIDGVSHPLPHPFMVFATQNPIEYEGTYPLPEAQLDRFLLKVVMDYPSEDEERAILQLHDAGFRSHQLEQVGLTPVMNAEELEHIRAVVREVEVRDEVRDYILQIVRRTRQNEFLLVGASPRAGIALLLVSKALAVLRGRGFVTPDDVKQMALPVLRHRLILKPEAEVEGLNADRILKSILEAIPVPR